MSSAPLEQWLVGLLPGDTGAWYASALADARRSGPGGPGFATAWSACGRRLGKAPLDLTPAEAARLASAGLPFVPAGWGTDEAARALLLLASLETHPSGEAVSDLYATGELREQQAIVRVLAHLPDPSQYAALAADAVRTNALPVLEALVCENPFPARHMPELAFNQLIMKAIFNGLSLRRVLGLPERNNLELRRMVEAYASERRAAGRTVPADVDFILGGTPNAPV